MGKGSVFSFLSPYPFSLPLAGGALARETKGSGDTGFPVVDSRTSGRHVGSCDVSKDSVGQSMVVFTSAQDFFVSNSQSKTIQINSKTLCPQRPSFLVPRPQSTKRSEKGLWGREWRVLHVL